MKAVFGGAVKKPLMTKVSMRHLNEIVRERNQYSRDALEAWQDFINLKGRMDTELSKVTKRNNFLVEELESWKQQVRFSSIVPIQYLTLTILSSSNSKHSPSSSPRRPKISRSRSKIINAKIVVSLLLLSSRRTILLASQSVFQVLRSSVMMPSRLSSSSKRLLKNWSASGSATRRNLRPCSIPISPFFDNVTRLSVLFCTFAA
jgi:hypothetical protein